MTGVNASDRDDGAVFRKDGCDRAEKVSFPVLGKKLGTYKSDPSVFPRSKGTCEFVGILLYAHTEFV
jgi:hypothetical protein